MEIIQEFKDEFRFLSNFYPSPIKLEGILYPTAEHAYQAQKTLDMERRKGFPLLETPGLAKRVGATLPIRPDWDRVKYSVMYYVVYAKFYQNPTLRKMLLATEDIWLVEGNNWGDKTWGVCLKKNQGNNWFGYILMLVRSQINEDLLYREDFHD